MAIMATTRRSAQAHGTLIAERASAEDAPPPGVRGMFISHDWLAAGKVDAVIALAQKAKLTRLYPCVLRYSRELFAGGKFPRYPGDGVGPADGDQYRRFLAKVRAADPGRHIQVIPWVEQFPVLKSRGAADAPRPADDDKTRAAQLERGNLFDTTHMPVLDLERPDVREMLLQQLVDLAEVDPEADAIHVDDHLSYPPGLVKTESKERRDALEKKLDDFVRFLVPAFKKRTGKKFEISCNPLDFAKRTTLAAWSGWPIDRALVQAYKATSADIIGPGAGSTASAAYKTVHAGAHVVGIGVTCKANDVPVAASELKRVLRFEALHGEQCVIWFCGTLMQQTELVSWLGRGPDPK